MKKIFLSLMIAGVALSSCDNMSGFFKNETDSLNSENNSMAMVVVRDMSITPENAYSDLFLDSTTMERYIQQEKWSDADAKELRSFYNNRNYQYAWFASEGITEPGRNFWNLYDSKIDTIENKIDKKLDKKMDTLLTEDSLMISATDTAYIKTELQLTKEFIRYARANKNIGDNIYGIVPAKRMSSMALADSFLNKTKDTTRFANNRHLLNLRNQLNKYHSIAQKGGWQPITLNAKQVRKGISFPAVANVKKRLQMTGDYTTNDTTAIFNDSLEVAIKSYQQRHGFNPDGIITDSLIRTMNIPVETRIQQILINLNRMAWMPIQQNNDQVIEVNIPAYMLHVYENNQKAFDMPVVVGKEGSGTTMFTGNLNQIVFSPYWNLPTSIVRDEIMPAIKSDPNYLKKKNMEIVKQNDSIPQIRQLPGKDNALGKVKFLFPNSFDIYFHDTPNKSHFEKQNRAYSHGCIRLADAAKMSQYLLRNQSEWTPEKIQLAMNSGKEQYVKLDKAVPVIINYNTAWVDENGLMNFREDIYKHDERTAKRLFQDGISLAGNMNTTSTSDTAVYKDTTTGKKMLPKTR